LGIIQSFMPMSRSVSTNTGVWKRSGEIERCRRELERLAGVAGIDADVARVAVRRVGAHHQVALLGARRHAGRRPGSLHVEMTAGTSA
jgi:hypothetical protein